MKKRTKKPRRHGFEITQEELEMLFILERRAREATEKYESLRGRLLAASMEGTPVEPGVHTCQAETVHHLVVR